jgi:hypothetical protein
MHVRTRMWAAVILASVTLAAPASAQQWIARFSGTTETPPNTSPGTGFSLVTLTGNSMRVQASWSGLLGTTTVAHIHCCTTAPNTGPAGVATPTPTFPGFPAGVTFGSYDQTFDMTLTSSWNAAFITNNGGTTATALTALVNGMSTSRAYFNVHSSFATGGEINGYYVTTPEPASMTMLGFGVLGIALAARRRRCAP